MIGVNFQPGSDFSGQNKPQGGTSNGGGIQEAIKVLSLRLPRVVGAQALSPQALLTSPGSGGSRVDSVVNQVLARFFPNAAPSQPAQSFGMTPSFDPYQGSQQPTFTPNTQYANPFGGGRPRQEAPSIDNQQFFRPRVIVDVPPMAPLTGGAPRWPGMPQMDGGGYAQPPASIGELPPNFTPPKRLPFPDDYPNFGGGGYPQEPEPRF